MNVQQSLNNAPIPTPYYYPGFHVPGMIPMQMPMPVPMPMQYYPPPPVSNVNALPSTAPPSVNSAPWHKTPVRPTYSTAVAPPPPSAPRVNVQVSTNPANSVNHSSTNVRPIVVASSSATAKWSAPMKVYVERCFATCKSAAEKDAMEELLRVKIKSVLGEGKMNNITWEREPIPQVGVIKREGGSLQGSSHNSSIDPGMVKNDKTSHVKVNSGGIEDAKLLERQKRFEADEREFKLQQARNRLALQNVSIADNQADVPDWDEETIVGTCQKLEKPYLRLTSAPDPATARPLPVLKRALDWLKEKWRGGGVEYGFICDQFKSLRQDMTVQRIKSDFTVSVYEIHARIAIEQGDWGEYNQCQTQLKQLYRSGLRGSEIEFLAYRLLYLLQCGDKLGVSEFLLLLQEQSGPIEHALAVQEALNTGNHAKVFQLYRNAPNMGVYLMDLLVQRERLRAFMAMLRAYRPTISFKLIQQTLGFDDDEDCKEWLKSLGCASITTETLDCKETLQLLIE